MPVVRALKKLSLDAPVTFFVGENGSGKSTILEGIAAAAGLPAVGSAGVKDDETLERPTSTRAFAQTGLAPAHATGILPARRGLLRVHEDAVEDAR